MKRERGNKSETRDLLDRYILENPGVSFTHIRKVFRINRGTLRYHLDYLQGEERIRSVRSGQQNCYYSNQRGAMDPVTGSSELNAKQLRLLRAIKEKPGISRKELLELTRQSREEINYNLRRLKDKKVIWKISDGGDPCFEYISQEQLAAEMMAIILEKFLDDEIDRETFLMLKRKLEEEMEN
jgi:predicted transcriptional regulator